MINRVVLVGRLTRDPELRVSQSNIPVGTFNLAVNRPFTNQQGERGADFINCVVFRKQAENVSQYLSKGSLVGVDGRLQSRSYENKEGRTIYVTEVVCDSVQFLEPKNSGNRQDTNSSIADGYTNAYGGGQQTGNRQASQSNYQSSQSNNQSRDRAGAAQEDNPFSNSDNGPVDISDDDLPF